MKVNNNPNYLTFILFVLINLSSAILFAQAPSIQKGDRIRILAPKYFNEAIKGTLIDIKNDCLFYQIAGRIFTLKLQDIKKLEVARGIKRNTGKRAIIGGVVTGTAIAILGVIARTSDDWGPSKTELILASAGWSVVGAGIGAIIGSGIQSTRWVRLSPEGLAVMERESSLKTEAGATLKKKPIPPVKKTAEGVRRWSLSFTFGTTSRGPAKDIESAMRLDGWDETEPIWPFTFGYVSEPERWQEHPYSRTGFGHIGFPWTIQISCAINQRFDGALLVNHAPIGTTFGYRSAPEYHLELNYYQTTASLMIVLKTPRILQFGLGPSLLFTKIEQENMYREKKTRLGALAQVAMQYPGRTRFFVNLDVQYLWTPKATFGPFKDTYYGNSLAQLNPFEADFSHIFFGFGIGFRL